MDLSAYITNYHTNDEIYTAKKYMIDYKYLLDDYNLDIGLIGRFFEKLFGTNKYHYIELQLQETYGMSYNRAIQILYDIHQEQWIFNPFKKHKNKKLKS